MEEDKKFQNGDADLRKLSNLQITEMSKFKTTQPNSIQLYLAVAQLGVGMGGGCVNQNLLFSFELITNNFVVCYEYLVLQRSSASITLCTVCNTR